MRLELIQNLFFLNACMQSVRRGEHLSLASESERTCKQFLYTKSPKETLVLYMKPFTTPSSHSENQDNFLVEKQCLSKLTHPERPAG